MYLFEIDEDEVDIILPYDTITVTRHGYNDYSIRYHNGDCSVRESATELLEDVTDNSLEAIKAFAGRNIFMGDGKLTITHGFVLVSSPWLNLNGDGSLNDAEALKHWGIRTTINFCLKALELINEGN